MPQRTVLAALLALAVGLVAGYVLRPHLSPHQLGLHAHDHDLLPPGSSTPPPHIGACPVFPADNIWNTRIDHLPRDPRSDSYTAAIGSQPRLHANFGSDPHNGIPFTELAPGTSAVEIPFEFPGGSDPGPYPVAEDAPIEGGPQSAGDRHVLVLDPRRCVLYELWHGSLTANGWTAGSGIAIDLTSNALRRNGATSADAAGLPVLPGLVRYDEILSGEIRHAIRFTLPRTRNRYVWPARHMASSEADPDLLPMGARLRLRTDFDLSRFSRSNRILLTALQRYGMLLADNGGPLYITGVPDRRWDDADLHQLGAVTAHDLEVVDEAALQLLPDSGRVDPVALQRSQASGSPAAVR